MRNTVLFSLVALAACGPLALPDVSVERAAEVAEDASVGSATPVESLEATETDAGDAALDAADADAEAAFDADAAVHVDVDGASDLDATTDSAADAEPHDSGADVEPEPPPPPPPVCTPGETRCNGYKAEACYGTWHRLWTDRSCCVDPRFSRDAQGWAVDATTGLRWKVWQGLGSTQSCQNAYGPTARLATTAEALDVFLGLPENGKAVCSPTLDISFNTGFAGDMITSDGCVSTTYGAVVTRTNGCSSASNTGYFCVMP